MGFTDSYTLTLTLKEDNGSEYTETHENISLSDFETIYGNEANQITELELKMNGKVL